MEEGSELPNDNFFLSTPLAASFFPLRFFLKGCYLLLSVIMRIALLLYCYVF